MQPPAGIRPTVTLLLLLALTLEGRPAESLLVLASASTVQSTPEVRIIPASTGQECFSEIGAYYGSDFPPTTHTNSSSAEECCRKCQASSQCTVWNWCGAAEGCLYPANLADAEGKIGVNFRTCDFKAQPITVSGTTALPPDITRTRDMAAWTSGIPLATKLLKAAPGYDLNRGLQMPYGSGSADFACAKSDTSKNVCELPGDVTAAAQACDADERCKGFQFCFRSTAQSSSAAARIRLKGAIAGPLNLTTAMFNPYCSIYVTEDPDRAAANTSTGPVGVPTGARRALRQSGGAAAAAPGQAAQPAIVDGSFNPLIGHAAGDASAAPMAAPAGGGGARRSGRPKPAPAPDMLRPAVPSEAPGSSTELDALLGTGASNSTITVTAAPGATNATAKNAPKGFDKFTPDYMGASGASQVTRNSNNVASGSQLAANPSLRAGLGSNSVSQDDVITPADGVSDIGASRTTPSSAGDGYNRTVKAAAVLAPLEYQSPMEIFPGAIFRYRPCAAGAPVAYLRADLMAVPSTRRENASAYAIHTWTRMPFQNNATCNRTCVYKLVDNDYFNLEDSYIARARPAYIATDPSLAMVPIADLDKAANGSVLAAPLLYIPSNEVANSTTERGLRFHMLRANTTSYINELVRMYYYTAQIALGNKACSAGFPGLKMALDYIQAGIQAQVAVATGQAYGSFASLNGVPLGLDFITTQDVTTGARRSYGQSCLSERNALYDGTVLVAGDDNLVTSAEDCCRSCWELGGRPGQAARANTTAAGGNAAAAAARGSDYVSSAPAGPAAAPEGPACNAWTYCSSPIGCKVADNPSLYQQGFCELKYSGDVARHRPVQSALPASGFVSGRTTAVLPTDMPNLFGAGSI
ncbi:g9613 [Coccomyxa elongata]